MEFAEEEFAYLEGLIIQTWGSFITSRTTEGMKNLQEIIAIFEELFQYSGGGKNNTQNAYFYSMFNGLFKRMEDAMRIPDYILLGDLLKYEMLPLIKSLGTDPPSKDPGEGNGFAAK